MIIVLSVTHDAPSTYSILIIKQSRRTFDMDAYNIYRTEWNGMMCLQQKKLEKTNNDWAHKRKRKYVQYNEKCQNKEQNKSNQRANFCNSDPFNRRNLEVNKTFD